ncbi:predicted protein [Postia placenta Mad-698-R]|nr:predicted protein [Postia placenta Mad-698-R]
MEGNPAGLTWGVMDFIPDTNFPTTQAKNIIQSPLTGILGIIERGFLPYSMKAKEITWCSQYKGHIHSPNAGQGANVSMSDAYNLAWKLAYALSGQATSGILDTYEEERRPCSIELINLDEELHKLNRPDSLFANEYVNCIAVFISALDSFKARTCSQLEGFQSLAPRLPLGQRLPPGDILRYSDWNPCNLHDLIRYSLSFKVIIFPGNLLEADVATHLSDFVTSIATSLDDTKQSMIETSVILRSSKYALPQVPDLADMLSDSRLYLDDDEHTSETEWHDRLYRTLGISEEGVATLLDPALPEKQPLDVVLTGSAVTARGRSPPQASLTTRPACIALQNEDRDEDAVVITSLNVIPFCCHADLLTMSRAELVVVADTLNARLPRILNIDVGRSRSAAYIRKSIELLVGLRKDATQTPEAERSRSVFTGVGEVSHSAGSPGLLDNATQQDASTGSVALEDSQEGFRDPDVASHRPQKKRRFDAEATVEASDRPMISRPITRSQSHQDPQPEFTGAEANAERHPSKHYRGPWKVLFSTSWIPALTKHGDDLDAKGTEVTWCRSGSATTLSGRGFSFRFTHLQSRVAYRGEGEAYLEAQAGSDTPGYDGPDVRDRGADDAAYRFGFGYAQRHCVEAMVKNYTYYIHVYCSKANVRHFGASVPDIAFICLLISEQPEIFLTALNTGGGLIPVEDVIALAFAYLFRIVLMDRFAVRWKNLLHDHSVSHVSQPETNAHQYLLARFVVALTTVSLFTALNCTMHAFLFGLLRSVVLPLLYMMPIVPQFLRPFTAHFLRGSWTMTLFFRHWSLLWRSFFLCLTTTTCWEMAESPLDEPVTVAHTTADPVLTVVSGITSADGYFKHFAYAELSQLARGYSPAASARRSALFADQKYNPSMWACLVRDALLTLGKDYQLLLRRGSPEAPAPAPAPAPPKPELTLPATPLKLLRTSVLKPTPTSPLRAALDTLASDGAISSAADSGVSQIPELFRSMVHASPSAEKAIESVKRSEERVVGMFEETRTKLQQRMEAAVHGRVPAAALEKMTPAFGVVERVRQWWTRDRVNKLVEMSLPNRHLDALAISNSYGVVQRDIPKIIEALLSFLAAVEEYQAEISKTHVTPSPEELQNMSAKERQEKERLMTELEQAGQIFAEVNDGLKEGIVHIVRTFGDKLAAFRFPPRIAQKLQGYMLHDDVVIVLRAQITEWQGWGGIRSQKRRLCLACQQAFVTDSLLTIYNIKSFERECGGFHDSTPGTNFWDATVKTRRITFGPPFKETEGPPTGKLSAERHV